MKSLINMENAHKTGSRKENYMSSDIQEICNLVTNS